MMTPTGLPPSSWLRRRKPNRETSIGRKIRPLGPKHCGPLDLLAKRRTTTSGDRLGHTIPLLRGKTTALGSHDLRDLTIPRHDRTFPHLRGRMTGLAIHGRHEATARSRNCVRRTRRCMS